MMLAIEISQRVGSVAMRTAQGSIHLEYLSAAQGKAGRHGDDLMPALDRLLARLDVQPRALSSVAVSIGPGSFTGLRIAVATARMLAETLETKVIAVPSARVAAENFAPRPDLPHDSSRLLVGLAGKRETFWSALLERKDGSWTVGSEPGLVEAASVELQGVTSVLADEFIPEVLRERCAAALVPIHAPRFDASACLRVAERLAEAGHFTDPLSLLPLYPRQPEAVSIWEQRKKKSASSR